MLLRSLMKISILLSLLSYLLAKVQRLEAEKPTKPPVVAADNKQCNCLPPDVVTYTRWGNSTCPYMEQIPYTLE